MIVSPSLLSADFGYLANELDMLNNSEAEYIHVDIMDGVFVPNISFAFPVMKRINQLSDKVMDVHMMIVEPQRYIEEVKKSRYTCECAIGSDCRPRYGVHYVG